MPASKVGHSPHIVIESGCSCSSSNSRGRKVGVSGVVGGGASSRLGTLAWRQWLGVVAVVVAVTVLTPPNQVGTIGKASFRTIMGTPKQLHEFMGKL